MTPPEAAEIVAEVAEEVADQATHVAEVSRGLSGRDVGLALGGFAVGAGVGGALVYYFLGRTLETKYNELAAEEIAQMREHYRQKAVALEAEVGKGDLADLVREKGYVPEEEQTAPPMAVAPPAPVVEAAEEAKEDEQDGVETPPPAEEDEPETRNIFTEHADPPEDEWDWAKERAQRSPLRPYVIHREERDENEAYDGVTFTYYEADDVVCDERDEVMDEQDRERIIGEANLEKFGHGSGDPDIVYIRNNKLEMDVEVVRSSKSYAEEVHGFEPEIKHSDRRRRRASPDDD